MTDDGCDNLPINKCANMQMRGAGECVPRQTRNSQHVTRNTNL